MPMLAPRYLTANSARKFLIAGLLACTAALMGPTQCGDHSDYTVVEDEAGLLAALADPSIQTILLAPGTYRIAPQVIDRPTALAIHGVNRTSTIIEATDGSQPLFRANAAAALSFMQVKLKGYPGEPANGIDPSFDQGLLKLHGGSSVPYVWIQENGFEQKVSTTGADYVVELQQQERGFMWRVRVVGTISTAWGDGQFAAWIWRPECG